jgi:hypothetical protein
MVVKYFVDLATEQQARGAGGDAAVAGMLKAKTNEGKNALHKAAQGATASHAETVAMLCGPGPAEIHPMTPDADSLTPV